MDRVASEFGAAVAASGETKWMAEVFLPLWFAHFDERGEEFLAVANPAGNG